MTARAYYNEHDAFAAAWLRELIARGLIADGDVDERSICDVTAADVAGYTQQHFFAGIGGWPLALRLAGWPDSRPVTTGSAPCQPFSNAGKGLGVEDARHLWPEFARILCELRPPAVFGEQVASAAGREWLGNVRADLRAMGYAVAAADVCAAAVGAPHIRQRLWWGAMLGGPPGRALVPAPAATTAWADPDWLYCRDGKWRPVAAGTFPLKVREPVRVGRLRGYGNAIVPEVGAAFVGAVVAHGPLTADTALAPALAGRASPLYGMTWKSWPVEGGDVVAVRAGKAKPERAGAGWPTPSAHGSQGESHEDLERVGGKWVNRATGRVLQTNLGTDAKMLAGWPTPAVNGYEPKDLDRLEARRAACAALHGNNGFGLSISQAAPLWAAWATPLAADGDKADATVDAVLARAAAGKNLGAAMQARLAGWATPAARDHRFANTESYADRGGGAKGEQLNNQVVHTAGWPTPQNRDKQAETAEAAQREIDRVHAGGIAALTVASHLAGWPTATTGDAHSTRNATSDPAWNAGERHAGVTMTDAAALAGWPTPQANNATRGGSEQRVTNNDRSADLHDHVLVAGWPTPLTVPDSDASHGQLSGSFRRQLEPCLPHAMGPARLTAAGQLRLGGAAHADGGGQLDPAHSRWLMGYPPAWCEAAIAADAAVKSRKQPRKRRTT